MVTASHNPIVDNGIKLSGSDGCMMDPSLDELI
jgi:phosphomannomutase